MPITKSAKKALRQNLKRRAKNLIQRGKIKKLFKEITRLVSEKKIEEAQKMLSHAYKAIDKAAKTGLFKKNTASRKKAVITKLVNRAKAVLAKT